MIRFQLTECGSCVVSSMPTDHLTSTERAALPLALARTPLCFVGMVASVDTEVGAKRLAAEIGWDVAWALALVRDLDRWQSTFS